MMPPRSSGIYSITNTFNGKRYIGRTVDLSKRKTCHAWRLNAGTHHNPHLQSAWLLHKSYFSFDVLEHCAIDKLNEREIYWIAYYDSYANGYNRCIGGEATTGYVFSKQSKEKISLSNKGKKHSDDAKMRIGEASRLMWERPGFREKMIALRTKAGSPWNIGLKRTEEWKAAVSKKLLGKRDSDETREKKRIAFSGEKSNSAKLKTRDVVDIRIRFLQGERQCNILKDYTQITAQTLYDICRNRRWKCVSTELGELLSMKNGGDG